MRFIRTIVCLLALLAGAASVGRAQFEAPRPTHPFVNYTEVGGLFGRVAYPTAVGSPNTIVENKVSLSLLTFNGAQLTPRLAVGGIVGVDWYAQALLLPVGAGLRYDLTRPGPVGTDQKSTHVFVLADVGYGLTWLDKASSGNELTRGGLMLNPGVGLRFGKPGRGGVVLSMSYKRQTVDASRPLGWNDIRRDEHRVYNRLAVRLGLSF
ncbi:hypothetical protein GCM10027578_25320 [Spirosoma luteolum]